MSALKTLSQEKQENWWKEILREPDVYVAIRNGTLNVYAKGQSVFQIELRKGMNGGTPGPIMRTHYKYLLVPDKPRDEQYVTFDGDQFLMKRKPIESSSLIQTSYNPNRTIIQLIKSAISHSDAEKRGVHEIAKNNPNVVDIEIAFSKEREANEPNDPNPLQEFDKRTRPRSSAFRMDLAAVIPWKPQEPRLVFCEAKCADNDELWKLKKKSGSEERCIAVVSQIAKYKEFISRNEDVLKKAYTCVCKTLLDLGEQGYIRRLDPIIRSVVEQQALAIHPDVFLLVYDYDEDQKSGRLGEALEKLGHELGGRVIANPKARNFHLTRDIQRMVGPKA